MDKAADVSPKDNLLDSSEGLIQTGKGGTRCIRVLQQKPDSWNIQVQFSCSVVPDSLWLHESQHIRPPCPSPTPRVHPWLKNVKKQTTATHGLFPAPRGSVGPEILSSGWERRGLEEKSLIPMSNELVMPSNHLILCHPLLLLPSIFPSLRVLPDESTLQIRWPKYWSFSFSISPSSEHPGLISFRMTGWISL